jgi:pimeloyl-ACP methyl ester carboxylesterase
LSLKVPNFSKVGKPETESKYLYQNYFYVKQQGLDQLALAYLQKEQPSTSKEELRKITQPLLVISADQDADNGSAKELAKLLPNSTLATSPGDHSHATSTPEFSKAVISFLRQHNY